MRTLGEPRVSIGAAAGSAEAARITVAWELTWYQWGGRPAASASEPRRRARHNGTEIDQLDVAAAASGTPNVAKLTVNVDGGARGNPGPAAIGAVVRDADGAVLEERGERIGRATNNVAEYRALLLGIELAAALGAERAGAGRRLGADRAPGRRPSTRSRTRR